MYDTLKLWYNGASMQLAPLLSNVIECRNEHQYFIKGYLNNLNVTLTIQGVKIEGSLNKWYLGNNIQTLTRMEVKRALEDLSDALNISIGKAKVLRMDIGNNFITKYDPSIYYYYLGSCSYYTRSLVSSSLYYQNTLRKKVFYDKKAELKKNGGVLPISLKNKNVLRIELRFLQKINKAFNLTELSAETLHNKIFFVSIIDKYINEYMSINKLHRIAFKENANLEPKDFYNQIFLIGIASLGGQNSVIEIIEEVRKKGQFKRPEYASRTKNMINELFKNETLLEPNELIEELNRKILALQTNYDFD